MSTVKDQLAKRNFQRLTVKCQLSKINSQMSTGKDQLAKINWQRSTVKCQHPKINCQMSTGKHPLTNINWQTKTFKHKLSNINFQTKLSNIQGGPLFLPPPKKTESQTWGEEKKNRVQELPPCLGLCFLGGGKNSGPPCRREPNRCATVIVN